METAPRDIEVAIYSPTAGGDVLGVSRVDQYCAGSSHNRSQHNLSILTIDNIMFLEYYFLICECSAAEQLTVLCRNEQLRTEKRRRPTPRTAQLQHPRPGILGDSTKHD